MLSRLFMDDVVGHQNSAWNFFKLLHESFKALITCQPPAETFHLHSTTISNLYSSLSFTVHHPTRTVFAMVCTFIKALHRRLYRVICGRRNNTAQRQQFISVFTQNLKYKLKARKAKHRPENSFNCNVMDLESDIVVCFGMRIAWILFIFINSSLIRKLLW